MSLNSKSGSDDTTIGIRMLEPELVRPSSRPESSSRFSRNMSLRKNKGGLIDYRKKGLFK